MGKEVPWSTEPVPRNTVVYSKPDELINNVRTNTLGLTWQFAYRLKDNTIQIKPHHTNPTKIIRFSRLYDLQVPVGYQQSWSLYNDIGVPYKISHGRQVSLLENGEQMTSLEVAGENLLVTTNLNRVFLYKATSKGKYLTEWLTISGQPFKYPIPYLTNARSRTLSLGVGQRQEIRNVEIMHENDRVDYMEDAQGQKHQAGFVLTYYNLSEDGKIIYYWDTGLPQDFARGVTSPRESVVINGVPTTRVMQGEQISAAGSMIFGCFRDYYNRRRYMVFLHDYEIAGGTPGLQYSVTPASPRTADEQRGLSGELILGDGTRHLPFAMSDWVEIDLAGIDPFAKLSSNISIYTTGAGNCARELRIIGTDRHGNFGYWSRNLTAESWNFVAASFELNQELPCDIVYNYNYDLPLIIRDYCLSQSYLEQCEKISLSLHGFNQFNPPGVPSIIKVTHYLPDGSANSAYINLHTVDGWSASSYPHAHDLVGSAFGIKKSLRGSVIINNTDSLTHDSILRSFVMKTFGRQHGKTNCMRVLADNQNIIIKSDDKKLNLEFDRELSASEFRNSFYMKIACDPALELPSSLISAQLLEQLKEHNQESLKFIKTVYHKMLKRTMLFTITDKLTLLGRPVAHKMFDFAGILGIKLSHHLKVTTEKVFKDAKYLLKASEENNKEALLSTLFKNNASYNTAIRILESRIENITTLLEQSRQFYQYPHGLITYGYALRDRPLAQGIGFRLDVDTGSDPENLLRTPGR